MVVIGGPQTRCNLTIVLVQVDGQAGILPYYLRACGTLSGADPDAKELSQAQSLLDRLSPANQHGGP